MVHKKKKKQIVTSDIKIEQTHEAGEEVNNRTSKTSTKQGRLIVRNLPFKGLNEKVFKEHFEKFGDIEDVKLLKKDDGKFVGCGFIQFAAKRNAVKAIYHLNGKEFLGRPIIVDWALPKNSYINKIKSNFNISEDDKSDVKLCQFSIDNKPETEIDVQDYENEEGIKVEEEEEDDDKEHEEIKPTNRIETNVNSKSPEDKVRYKSNDISEGKTVFVKNIPFSVTNDELKKCMLQFGHVFYALVCVDPLTEHSKGTGFVKFQTKESADKCIEMSKNVYIEENALEICPAVSKDTLAERKKPKEKKDNRNLYLVKEGVIMAGSKAAVGISTSDMSKRLEIENWKSQMLRNLNMFVARTRIVIHNLPMTYTDDKLRDMVMNYSQPGTVIKEARILRDRKKVDSHGLGVSKQVGFVTFNNHDNALWVLRNINNNPAIFTPDRRPIVTFSIENKEILNLKQKRLEKSRNKSGVTSDNSKLNRKQRRGIRRKQKKIEKFQAERKLKREKRLKESGETIVKQTESNKEENVRKRKKSIEKPMKNPKRRKLETPSKKPKNIENDEEIKQFTGVQAEPGKIFKLTSRKKLSQQAKIHGGNMKKQKLQRRKLMQKKIKEERIREPKQKRGKGKMKITNDEKHLSKLISSYKDKIQKQMSLKKWYDT